MKLFIIILLMLSIIPTSDMFAQDGLILKVIDMNGDTLLLNTKEIEKIVFDNRSSTSRFILNLIDDKPLKTGTRQIKHITFIDSIDQLLINYRPYSSYNDYFVDIERIENIVLYNSNQYKDEIYKKIEIEISGLNFEYYRSNSNNKVSIEKFSTLLNLNNNFYLGNPNLCLGCGFYAPNHKMFFCYNNYTVNNSNNICTIKKMFIFLNSSQQTIDSLFYILSHDEGPATTGYRTETYIDENIKFHDIPFTINEDGEIIVDIEMNEDIIFSYNYNIKVITGNSSNYSTFGKRFTKIDSYDEDAKLTIKISP